MTKDDYLKIAGELMVSFAAIFVMALSLGQLV